MARPARTALLAALAGAIALAIAIGGCGSDETSSGTGTVAEEPGGTGDTGSAEQRFPEIVDASAEPVGDGSYDLEVTVSSPYDTPERYADGWRVLGPDGEVLGEMELLHDHASEQPFTRVQAGLVVPEDVRVVTIEGRDLANGYGGGTVELELPRG